MKKQYFLVFGILAFLVNSAKAQYAIELSNLRFTEVWGGIYGLTLGGEIGLNAVFDDDQLYYRAGVGLYLGRPKRESFETYYIAPNGGNGSWETTLFPNSEEYSTVWFTTISAGATYKFIDKDTSPIVSLDVIGHKAFYNWETENSSELTEDAGVGLQLSIGGTMRLSDRYAAELRIGKYETLIVGAGLQVKFWRVGMTIVRDNY